MIERLRAGNFDAAVIFTVYSQNPLPAAMLCHLSGIPLRLAYCRENPYRLLSDWIPEPDPGPGPARQVRHEVRRQLDLVGAIGGRIEDERLSIEVPSGVSAGMSDRLREVAIAPGRPWVAIHPGCSAPSRRYAPGGYARLARELTTGHGLHVVFTGSGEERVLIESIREEMEAPSISMAGKLDLAHLAALLREAPLLIANNTGPDHLAAAVRTPVVVLYAGTNFQHTPWGVPPRVLTRDVPCSPCYQSVCPMGHHECLRLVPAETAVRATIELLGETARSR